MDTKKFKMNLLNAEEMKDLTGGAAPPSCSKAGDTLRCNGRYDYVLCASYEVTCSPAIYINGPVFGCDTGNKFTTTCIKNFVS